MMTARPKRKAIPMRVQRDACLLAFGMQPDQVEFHHNPPIELRPLNEDGTDTVPPMNDPRHIEPMLSEAHKRETFGDPAIPLSGDVSKIAKTKRLEKKTERFNLAAQVKLLGADSLLPPGYRPKRSWPKGRKMQSRPFPERWKR
jgi:hypothetical protein